MVATSALPKTISDVIMLEPETGFLSSRFARRLITIFLVSAALPVVTLAGLTFASVTEQLLKQNRIQQEQDTKAFGLTIYEQLNFLDAELQLLASSAEDNRLPTSIRSDETLRFRLGEKFSGIWLQSDHHGLVPLLEGSSVEDVGKFASQDLNTNTLLETVVGIDGRSRILMSRRYGSEGRPSGSIVAEVKSEYLWNPDTFEAHKNYCVVGHKNRLLYCSQQTGGDIRDRMLQISRDEFSGYQEWNSSNSNALLVTYWSIFLNGQFAINDWVALISVPRQEVLQPITSFQTTFLVVFAITILLVVLLSSTQIRRILTPLRKLTAAIQDVGNSRFDSRVEVDSNDEFEDLARSFNAMGRKLSDQFQSLETMAEIDRLILSSQDAESVVQFVLAKIQVIIDCREIGITILDKEGNFSRMYIRVEKSPDTFLEHEVPIHVTEQDRKFLDANPDGSLETLRTSSLSLLLPLRELEAKACLVLPLFFDDRLSAIVMLGYQEIPVDVDEKIQETKSWADRVAVALSNAKWQEKLFRQANFDSLTGLPNRPAFRSFLQQALARAERNKEFVGLLFIDLDRFKLINDTLGHAAGDEYLNYIANRLSGCIRSSDLLARLGGDEFTIVIAESPSYEHIKKSITAVAEKLLSVIKKPISINGQDLRTNASIGVSIYPLDGENIEDLMKHADSAMYQAKAAGGGEYHFFSKELNKIVSEQLRIESEIRQAVKRDEFELFYQPQIDALTGTVLGAEALLRWNHPRGEFISPGVFIPLAEESQLIVEIDKWVLNAACAQIRAWEDAGRPSIRISVNLSARFFRQPGVIGILRSLVAQYEIEARFLELEITEGTLIEDIESAIEVLRELTELGFQLTIDDFGTGYSSLTYLKRLPIHKLKIDKSFVDYCNADHVDGALVRTIINVAKSLDLDCIAEGVEDKEQLEFLQKNGCTEIQGYYFSKPKPAREFAVDYLSSSRGVIAAPAQS